MRIRTILIKNGLQHSFSDLFGRKSRQWLKTLELRPVYLQALDGYRRLLDFLDKEILPVSREIDTVEKFDPRAMILESVPGAGLNPSVHSSGRITRYGRITKQGSSWFRWSWLKLPMWLPDIARDYPSSTKRWPEDVAVRRQTSL